MLSNELGLPKKLNRTQNMKTPNLCKPVLSLFAIGGWALLTPAIGQDQSDSEDLYELSPFVVDTTGDVGYLANNTLAGSRMRTSLSDVPNAITVFTQELIEDLGATSESELLRYSSAAVEENTDQTSGVQGISLYEGIFGSRIRGQVATRSRNYFETVLQPDTYNSERFEEARGPNAILFGLGGSGGLLNTSTKKAFTTRNATQLSLRVDNWDITRFTLDHNLRINEKLAIRVNGLLEDGGGIHPGDVTENKRFHIAATYKPHQKVTISAEYEWGDLRNSVTRSFLPRDVVSVWALSGRPTFANATQAASPALQAQGLNRLGVDQRLTFIANDGNFTNFQQTIRTDHLAVTGRNRSGLLPSDWAAIEPNVPFPERASFMGPGAYVDVDQYSASLFVEVQPLQDLFVELAVNQDSRTHNIWDQNIEAYELRADVMQNYRDGSPNPYTGEYYIETFPIRRYSDVTVDRYRVTAAYMLDLGKWGRHNIAGLWSRDDSNNPRSTSFFAVEGAPFNANPAHPRNRVRIRNYITDLSNRNQWSIPDWRSLPSTLTVNNDTGAAAGKSYNLSFQQDGATNEVVSEIDSTMITLQSYWLSDRIITTLGLRNVDYAQTRGTGIDEGSLERKSFGIVAKPTHWLSTYYNYSENGVVPTSVQTLIPDESVFPINSGEGEDYGVMLTLLDNRVFVRAGYFKSASVDQAKAMGNTIIRNTHERIVDAFVTAGLLSDESAAPVIRGGDFDLADVETKGYEFSVTANITDNWRLTLNMTQSESTDSKLLKIADRVLSDLALPVWTNPAGQNLIVSNGKTVAQDMQAVLDWQTNEKSLEGDATVGHQETSFRVFTRYDFRDGFLKGAFIGGGLVYGSEPVIGKNRLTNEFIKGSDSKEADLLLGYRMNKVHFLGGPKNFVFQLNAQNLIQDIDYRVLRADPDGQLWRAKYHAPRRFMLSIRMDF
jgi:iron complex outermembrane recepter protein